MSVMAVIAPLVGVILIAIVLAIVGRKFLRKAPQH